MSAFIAILIMRTAKQSLYCTHFYCLRKGRNEYKRLSLPFHTIVITLKELFASILFEIVDLSRLFSPYDFKSFIISPKTGSQFVFAFLVALTVCNLRIDYRQLLYVGYFDTLPACFFWEIIYRRGSSAHTPKITTSMIYQKFQLSIILLLTINNSMRFFSLL